MSRRIRHRRAGRLLAALLSIGGHLAILAALIWPRVEAPTPADPTPIEVSLVDMHDLAPKADPTPKPAPTPHPKVTKPKPVKPMAHHAKPKPAPSRAPSRPSPPSDTDDADPGTELTSAQIAGAAYAGSGGKGGACDMSARLLAALRRDPLVVSAIGGSPGKALLVWNGDWVRSRGEDGKGLAAVREAMMWEVGFAPPECRAQPMHGLILFALGGGVKVVVGAGQWRWSDMLRSHGGGPVEGASWR